MTQDPGLIRFRVYIIVFFYLSCDMSQGLTQTQGLECLYHLISKL